MADDFIKVHDLNGRELRIPRAEWVKRVLPDKLKRAWDDADALFSVIQLALRDGFAALVIDASARLVQLDPKAYRSACLRAAVQLREGEEEAAERTLRAHIREHGESPPVLAHLATLFLLRGNSEEARKLLRQALRLDPNCGEALECWGKLHQETGGILATEAAMAEVAQERLAWRPQLWLARTHLERDELDKAVELYREVLARAGNEADALTQMSGDLGKSGYVEEVFELIGDVYSARQHGPYAGMNLAQALFQLGRYQEARATLDAVRSLNVTPLASRLDALDAEIHKAQRFAN